MTFVSAFLKVLKMNFMEKYKARLNDVRQGKDDITGFVSSFNAPCFLIDQTLLEINRRYVPGTIESMKVNRPDEWDQMIALEKEINEKALKKDVEGLKKVLGDYKIFIQNMIRAFP